MTGKKILGVKKKYITKILRIFHSHRLFQLLQILINTLIIFVYFENHYCFFKNN